MAVARQSGRLSDTCRERPAVDLDHQAGLLGKRGDAHLGFDFQRFGPTNLHVAGTRVDVMLPPLEVQVALRPGETEIIDSNLDSTQTAQLLEKARLAFEHDVRSDSRLHERARQSAERSLRALLLTLGFREVRFVDALPTKGTAG